MSRTLCSSIWPRLGHKAGVSLPCAPSTQEHHWLPAGAQERRVKCLPISSKFCRAGKPLQIGKQTSGEKRKDIRIRLSLNHPIQTNTSGPGIGAPGARISLVSPPKAEPALLPKPSSYLSLPNRGCTSRVPWKTQPLLSSATTPRPCSQETAGWTGSGLSSQVVQPGR